MDSSTILVAQLMQLQRQLKKATYGLILSLLLTILSFFSINVILNSSTLNRIFALLLIIAGCIAFFFVIYFIIRYNKVNVSYRMLYKEKFVESVLNQLFEHAQYHYTQGFSKSQVEQMRLSAMGNRFHSEDYIEADYHGVHFRQADVRIQNVTHSGKTTHTTTYFKGRMYDFEFPKDFSAGTHIQSRNYMYPAHLSRSYEKIEMESVAFNKEFKVTSEDAHTTFYLLTPPLMEQITKVNASYNKRVNLHFERNHLYIATWTEQNALEPPSIHGKIDYATEHQRVLATLNTIIAFIDLFDLD